MKFLTGVCSIVVLLVCVELRAYGNASSSHYTNTWAVHIPNVDQEKVNEIARRHGMTNLGQIGTLEGYYHFKHRAYPRRMRRETVQHTAKLSREFKIKWVEQQVAKRRVKRDGLFPDPWWNKQWYLHNEDRVFPNYDHNVIPVWTTLNITGRGVSVSILDDGIEKDHPDLKANYDPDASYDYNSNDADPSPRPTFNDENRHGTRCAGEVAAVAGNGHCGIGVAYGAKVGGIRMLDGEVTDAVEAHSLSRKPEHIDIYSSSWGPDDDGKTVDGPGSLAKIAFSEGIARGRRGLGNIFVWASGNGGRDQDNCNCDGYTNSIYTLSISSATEHGTSPWYSEFCASTLASTFSSGSWGMRKIVTTDLHHRCTQDHTGTSASAPLAAGILALALEANPKLTWRDMQHIVVRTSKSDKLKSNDWVTNGVGRRISHRFGYGLLDAKALVDLAMRWETVPEKHDCSEAKDTTPRSIPRTGSLRLEKETTGCEGSENYIRYLEHVEVVLSLSFSRRGDLTIYLTSPQGTRSTLLGKRRVDYSTKGFKDWAFMSTHNWEENPRGKWILEIENAGSSSNSGTLTSWQLRFHGTEEQPGVMYANCSRECIGGCRGPDASDCLQCANYKSNGVCVSKCKDNEYAEESTKECKTCASVCEKCDGPSSNQCSSCKTPKLLKEGSCVTSCSNGWFATENNRCEKCDPSCLTCSSSATSCTACKVDHKLEKNRCIIDCKSNEYVSNDMCWPCHPSCSTCNNGTAWSCTKCGVTTATREGVKQDLYLHRGMCVVTCPSGFYGNNYQCVPCHISCKHCKGPLATNCTSCKDGLVRADNGTGLCLDNCPSGSSHRISEDTCVKCRSNCSACDPDDPSSCTACDKELFLWKHKCATATACPSGSYPEVASRRCKYCDPSCDKCIDPPTSCTACSGYSYLHDNTCKPVCPTGTYGKENKCLQCHASCSSCFGGDHDQCLKCADDLPFFNNSCVKECPLGMFADKTGRCQLCSLVCDGGCVGVATNCTSCKDGFNKLNGVCKSACQDGTFRNSTLASQTNWNKTQDVCSDCDMSCSTCFGPTKYDCLRCKGLKFRDPISKLCSLDCPKRGYYYGLNTTLCERCPSECSHCGNPNACLKCVPGLVLYEGKCILHCPEGFYAEKNTNVCKACDSTCKDCAGSSTSCIKCGLSQILFQNQCVTKCPSGMFLSKEFNRCLPCDDACSTCVGASRSRCTSCKPGLVLFQAQCRTKCPARYYHSTEAKSCQACDYYCHKCSGPSSCEECIPPFVLEKNQCVRTCSPGYVLNRMTRACVPCHESCQTCMGPTKDQCLSCKNSKDSLQGSVCTENCAEGMYRNAETSQCESCHPLCKACSGAGKDACTSCVEGLSHKSSQCISSCQVNEYKNHGKCYVCSNGCKTCKGATRQHCLSCNDGGKLFNFTCVKNCPLGTYERDSNDIPECEKCHPSCVTCTRAGADACSSCRMDLYLQGTTCVQQCSIKHRLDENTRKCKLCDGDCPTYTNITDRSALLRHHNDDNSDVSPKLENHFILISMATCLSLLAVFALLSVFRSRATKGYTKVDNNSSSSVEAPQPLDNNVPSVYIRDDNAERVAMLSDGDDDEM